MTILSAQDDFLHPVTDHPDHNESAYYNFGTTNGLVGWVRIGNRVNDGFAEVTVCLYLPDGRLGMWWDRADIADPSQHDAGGLSFTVLEPFRRHHVSYAGSIAILSGPRALEHPGRAFKEAVTAECRISLDLSIASPPWGGGTRGHNSAAFANFAGNHFEQHMTVSGTVTVGAETFPIIDGLSLRDHSWGPRRWQELAWYRWLTCSFTPALGFACTIVGNADGSYVAQGYVHRGPDQPLREIVDAALRTEWDGTYPARAIWTLGDDQGERYEVIGDIRSALPLRHRRDGEESRIIEGATTYHLGGQLGVGMSEYLDLLADGAYAGVEAERRGALSQTPS